MSFSHAIKFSYITLLLSIVAACSGGGGSNGDTKTAPVITSSATAVVEENTTAVMTVSAADAEGDSLIYSLTGSVDDSLFNIESTTGLLSFLSAPDFETPVDSGADNIYNIQVTASDGTHTATKSVSITVSDVFDLNVTSSGVKTLAFSWSAYSGVSYYKLLVNPDGASGYIQEGTDTTDTSFDVVIPVHLTDWLNASFILEAYDSGGSKIASTDAITVTSLMLSSIGYFKASNPGAYEWFGISVALSDDGNTLAVGANGESSATTGINSKPSDDGTANGSGAVYLFRFDGSSWSQQAYIKASNAGEFDNFGWSVALSSDGNTLAVGANYESSSSTGINSTPDDWGTLSGAVYLFRFNGGSWSQQAYIKASNAGEFDYFGWSVALSSDGNTLAVGANYESSASTGINSTPNDDGTSDDSGAVYLFRFIGSSWSQQAYLKADSTEAGDHFGRSVALSGDGNSLAVGASGENRALTGVKTTLNDDSGAAYLFRFNGTDWSQQAYLKAANTGAGDNFGYSVALSNDGNTLAVGAYGEGSTTTGIDSTPDDGTFLSGATYVFRFNGSSWLQQAYLKASNAEGGDIFGHSVALSSDGDTLVVGAPREESASTGINSSPDEWAGSSGAAYLFRFNGSNWSQQAYIKASNTGVSDVFGWSVALSNDGNTLASGAISEDSASTGINSTPNDDGTADASGAVYLY